MVNFNDSDRVELIEVTQPAEILLRGVALLGRNYREVISDLERDGIVGVEDDSGIEFRDLCFALYNPAPEEGGSEVEGVTLFAPGYYE
ncbi:hypothetical protein AB0I68_32525 [Streptomyces sp. NPDC050448]|uniref:hypothetical protein n=1 Tax=Streptomyces sp. NPDC050448 TaxID=3155404 RepID=UPI00341ECCBA